MIAAHPRCRFQGSYVALPTPFRHGRLDVAAFDALIEFHARSGTDGIVVCGTTGESATLTDEERRVLVERAIARARRRMPVVAGVGTNDTRTTLEHARHAARAGADALLVVTPYYNRPSPEGLFLHFAAVAQAVETPLILYNVPSRTGVDLVPEVARRVGESFPHVVAVKEALASTERVKRLVGETPLGVLCGDDASIADFVALGALGVVGVVNNLVPAEVAELVRCAVPGGDATRAAALVEFLRPLTRDLYVESNPVPVKAALAWMRGDVAEDVRLPLAPLAPASRERLRATLVACGLLGRERATTAAAT